MKPQARTLLEAMQRGEVLTPLIALERYQCLSLSQRCGELYRLGYPVRSRLIRTDTGKHVAEYRLEEV